MPVEWNFENAAHLLRRAGFGDTPKGIARFVKVNKSVEDGVDDLLKFGTPGSAPPAPRKDNNDNIKLRMQRWWLKRMIGVRKPGDACREKFVLFLHGMLVSGLSSQPVARNMARQNRLFRRNSRGNFKELVREFNRNPANLYYLDGIINFASSDGVHVNANENFGRELLELFTLGPFQLADDGTDDPSKPSYTEDDVHNLSRAVTGWTSIKKDVGVWNPDHWDGGRYDDNGDDLPDPMVIFGQSSNNFRIDEEIAGTADDVLELIFSRTDDDGNNHVGMFLAKELWSFYAYPPPSAGLKAILAELAAVFVAGGFELLPLLQAMFTHDEFFSDKARSRSVRNPVDYVIQAIRALGVKSDGKFIGDANDELSEQICDMGMDLFEPPNVGGWPGGLDWINSGALLERFNFAKDLAASDFGRSRLRIKNIETLPLKNEQADAEDVVNAVLRQLGLDTGPLALTEMQVLSLVDYASDFGANPTLDLSNDKTDDANTKVRGLIALALQSAESQVY
jgi:uncharacterized protein (DUF1800 family)